MTFSVWLGESYLWSSKCHPPNHVNHHIINMCSPFSSTSSLKHLSCFSSASSSVLSICSALHNFSSLSFLGCIIWTTFACASPHLKLNWGEPYWAPPYEVNSEIGLIACLLDTSSLTWLKAIHVDNQNYIKHINSQLSADRNIWICYSSATTHTHTHTRYE